MNVVDTNVLVYACSRGDLQKRAIARSVLEELGESRLLWQVACEFISASRKLEAEGFTPTAAWDALAGFASAFPLTIPSHDVLGAARTLHELHQWAFWDALIVAACQELGARRLYSEDLPGQRVPIGPPLEIINPFAATME